MSNTNLNSTGVRVLPPIVFIIALILGTAIGYIFPIALPFSKLKAAISTILIIASLFLGVCSALLFRKHNTDIDPMGSATMLLKTGPYKYSRNPIYVSMIILIFGIGVLLGNTWILLMLIPAVLYLRKNVVLLEEKHLIKQFGNDYKKYSSDVRRWL